MQIRSVDNFGIDNSHFRLISFLVNKNNIPGKNLLEVVKFQNLVKKCCNVWENIALQSFQICSVIVLRAEIVTTFRSKMEAISTSNKKI